jgi:hypothetical protein
VCPVGTKCFDKKPPVEYIEGKPVVRTDVPESQWPEPSPIRYALGKGEDFLRRLMKELDEAALIEDIELEANQNFTRSRSIAHCEYILSNANEILKELDGVRTPE